MEGEHFVEHLGKALLAALAGGLVARLLRLPLLVGYLAAGIVIGPHTPGFTANERSLHDVATLGVALLMFAVGTHLSLRELAAVRRIALIGGSIQIVGTILLGLLLGLWLGWGLYGGAFLGCALALSSTAVMMRLLEERGELGTAHGRALMAVLVVQDLAVVLMVALLPSLGQLGNGGLATVGLSLLKAILSVGLALFLALNLVPALLHRVARQGSQELFLLVVVCICLAAAYLAQLAGLSLELGAFLAGLVISESDYAHEVFNQVRPLRDLFASLFFVSVGMLLDPRFVAANWMTVSAVVLVIVLGKGVLATVGVFLSGCHGRTSVIAGLGLAQIGEFSFVLATLGVTRGLIPDEIASVILASALITILATPFVFAAAPKLYTRLSASRGWSRLLNRKPDPLPEAEDPVEPVKVIILGCGRVGRYVSDALRASEVSHLVVDYHGEAIERLQASGVPTVYGDATSLHVLEQTHADQAELAIVALPEAATTEMAVRALKHLAPNLTVVARVHRGIDIPRIRAAGAEAVIHAEFEAGMEMIRQGLDRLGFKDARVDEYLETLRQERYRGG